MKKPVYSLMIACSVAMFTACGPSENDSNKQAEEQNEQKFDDTKMENDADFATKAASGGMMEVELGKLAVANAGSADVKAFGQNMIDDHTKANDELKAAAQAKNITLPDVPDADAQKKISDLSAKKGADFDKAYMDLMVSDHKEDIDEFQKEANDGKDADLKSWAAGKVPVLQHHLEMAQGIKDKLK